MPQPAPLVTDRIADALRDAILAGAFPPGARLKLLHLARHFGVSPLPVREALVRLAAEQFVELLPNRGAQVRALTGKVVSDIYDVRGPLEALLAARAAERADAPALQHIVARQRDWEAAATAGRTDAVLAAEHAFHRAIAEAADSPEAATLALRALRVVLALSAGRTLPRARLAEERVQHRALLAALMARDPIGARDAAWRHATTGCAWLLGALKADGVLLAAPR